MTRRATIDKPREDIRAAQSPPDHCSTPSLYARVEVGVCNIDQEIGEDEHCRHRRDDALHDREVASRGRLQRKESDTRPIVDKLDDEGPAEHEAHLQTKNRYEGDGGVLQSMDQQDSMPGDPFRPGAPNIVFGEGLEYGLTHDAKQRCDQNRGKCDDR